MFLISRIPSLIGGAIVGAVLFLALVDHGAVSQVRQAPPPQVQPGCITPQQLAEQWPTGFGRIKFGQHELDPSKIPFNQIHLMNIACGIVRGEGVDDFIAYSVKREYGRVRVLAVYERAEHNLANLGLLVDPLKAYGQLNPEVLKVADLKLEDLTGDGRPEAVFTAGDPGCASWISVWGLRHGDYGNLITATGAGCLEITGSTMDGRKQIVFWFTPPEGGSGPDDDGPIRARVWPWAVYKWKGDEFRKVLEPALYSKLTDFVEKNRIMQKKLESDEILLLALGQAYELQGKHAQARAQYARAWDGADHAYRDSDFPADWNDQQRADLVLSKFYDSLEHMALLTEAYGRFAPQLRSAQGFADFAAAQARIENITQDGKAQVAKAEGNTITATVHLVVKKLTEDGETEKPYVATWQICRDNGGLISGAMKPL